MSRSDLWPPLGKRHGFALTLCWRETQRNDAKFSNDLDDTACESPPASFPFDGSESARAISTVSPSGLPRISQSRVTPGNLRTIRTAISLLSGAPHSTLLHLPRSTPRELANACWPPRPLKPIASRKRRARFDVSLPG